MDHQTFIQEHQSSLNVYFEKLNKRYSFETSSFNQRLKRKTKQLRILGILSQKKIIKLNNYL